jgi:hypothetical protein
MQNSAAHAVFNVPVGGGRRAHESRQAAVHRGAGLLTQRTGARPPRPRGTLLTQQNWDETRNLGPASLRTFNGT